MEPFKCNNRALVKTKNVQTRRNPAHVECFGGHRVCVCTCVWLVPDVRVEDFSERVENTDHGGHRTEEDDSSHRGDALQHRVHPHACHMVHPTRPEQGGGQKVQFRAHFGHLNL